jgi:hypothetical protein
MTPIEKRVQDFKTVYGEKCLGMTVGLHTVKVMTVKRVLVEETVTVWIVPLDE